ncbi:MAG: hypothetical protein ACI89X_002363 [Planctomycetota bacterium]|jgi:hypothetical protein
MDRSYLSDQQVVEASREFVCARLITFEDSDEAKLMNRLFGGGRLVNTVFTIMDPKGKSALVRAGRSPKMAFDDAAAMANKMAAVAMRFPGRKKVVAQDLGLPVLEDVRIALNVTECDAQMLVILRGDDKQVKVMRRKLTELSWSGKLIGRFLYAVADDKTDWQALKNADKAPKAGVLIARSDEYGLTGEIVASAKASVTAEKLEELLLAVAAKHNPKAVDTRRLRRQGIRNGVQWQVELPTSKGR